MLRKWPVSAATLICSAMAMPVAAQQPRILIMGGANHDEYLGCLSCSEMERDSVWNDMSTYSWNNGFGKWNSFGPHRNPYGGHSACNTYSRSPPILVDAKGTLYGTLSINPYAKGSICGPNGVERVCIALKVMCSGN